VGQNGKIKAIGILTAGGDCPGLNAVIRAITKSLLPEGVRVYGFLEGFRGLVENRYIELDDYQTSGLLTTGGTVLRTSRDKPHKMPTDNGAADRINEVVANVKALGLDCVVCIGGGGTHKNVARIMERGRVNFVTVPKTIDNDVWGTDTCVGFDTAMAIATEALDRLHTTASSHHRVMVVDIMGHNAGWLALGSGIAGGADVILIPEIPYDLDLVAESLRARMDRGKMFSLVAVAEGAVSMQEALARKGEDPRQEKKKKAKGIEHSKEPVSAILAEHLEDATGLETRVTSLGHIQRGGVPTPTDRLIATKYGTQAAEFILEKRFGVMVAKRGQEFIGVPIQEVADRRRHVPLNHPWVAAARFVGTCLGDEMPHGYKASQRARAEGA
jgi:6-phosphofructokinase 1